MTKQASQRLLDNQNQYKSKLPDFTEILEEITLYTMGIIQSLLKSMERLLMISLGFEPGSMLKVQAINLPYVREWVRFTKGIYVLCCPVEFTA